MADLRPAPAISTRGLSKRYGGTPALDALDLDVPQGSIFGLLGRTGAGKSTVIRLLTGLARPNDGSATIAGQPVRFGGAAAARRGLGAVLQDPGLPGWMTGRELLAFMADVSGVDAADVPARIEETAAGLALEASLDLTIAELPAPARGRLGIAQALVAEPEVLLLDEPFHWLDPEGRLEVRARLRAIRGRTTILIATHRLADVEGFCDRVAVLDEGQLLVHGSTGAFLARFAAPVYVIEVAGSGGLALEGLVARLRAETWVREVAAVDASLRVAVADDARAARELLPAVVATGLGIDGIRRVRPPLEAVVAGLRRAASSGAAA